MGFSTGGELGGWCLSVEFVEECVCLVDRESRVCFGFVSHDPIVGIRNTSRGWGFQNSRRIIPCDGE